MNKWWPNDIVQRIKNVYSFLDQGKGQTGNQGQDGGSERPEFTSLHNTANYNHIQNYHWEILEGKQNTYSATKNVKNRPHPDRERRQSHRLMRTHTNSAMNDPQAIRLSRHQRFALRCERSEHYTGSPAQQPIISGYKKQWSLRSGEVEGCRKARLHLLKSSCTN